MSPSGGHSLQWLRAGIRFVEHGPALGCVSGTQSGQSGLTEYFFPLLRENERMLMLFGAPMEGNGHAATRVARASGHEGQEWVRLLSQEQACCPREPHCRLSFFSDYKQLLSSEPSRSLSHIYDIVTAVRVALKIEWLNARWAPGMDPAVEKGRWWEMCIESGVEFS